MTLEVPQPLVEQLDTANPIKRVLVSTDLEGAPIAAIDAVDTWPTRDGLAGWPAESAASATAGKVRSDAAAAPS